MSLTQEQPASEIRPMALSPPFQGPTVLLLVTTDVRQDKPEPHTHRSPPQAPPLPYPVAGREPSVSLQPSRGARQTQRRQPASRPSAAARRAPHARARRIARPPGPGWQPREGVVQERGARTDGLGGSQVLSPRHPGLARAPSPRSHHPSLPKTLLPAANAAQGAAGSAPPRGLRLLGLVTGGDG